MAGATAVIPPSATGGAAAVGPAGPAVPVDPTDLAALEAAATAGLSSQVTQAVWATFLLFQINATGNTGATQTNALGQTTESATVPITLNNIENIERWMEAEEPSGDWFHNNNPLNINAGGSGSDTFPNLAVAAQKTAQVITQPNMAPILDVLLNDAPPPTFSAAVVSTPWAASHYGVAAAGAPLKYIVPGRTITYLATIPLPDQVSAGTGADVLPADPGQANPESDFLPTSSGLFGDLEAFIADVLDAAFWKRVGLFVGGAVLIIMGTAVFISTTKPGQEAISTAGTAAVLA